MKKLIKSILCFVCLILMGIGCKKRGEALIESEKIEFNQKLATKLSKMAEIDQYYAGIPTGKLEGNWEAWYIIRDSSTRAHKEAVVKILKEYGYPGYDLVGASGESDFWVMVQHADYDPEFQASVLPLLKKQIDKNNANGSHYGLLVDRVRRNIDKPQLYGTQVEYNYFGQAYIKFLDDSINVNKRRKEFGMELLEEYLNDMTKMHFEMNKEYLKERGITKPKLYLVPYNK